MRVLFLKAHSGCGLQQAVVWRLKMKAGLEDRSEMVCGWWDLSNDSVWGSVEICLGSGISMTR